MTRAEVNRRIDEFLLLNGAAVRINDAGRELGQIAAFNNPTYDVSTVVPTVGDAQRRLRSHCAHPG